MAQTSYSKYGYYLDIFILEQNYKMIEDHVFLNCIQSALYYTGLKIQNLVNKKEFSENTKSVPVNRYARMPLRFLGDLDDRVYTKSTLDKIVFVT